MIAWALRRGYSFYDLGGIAPQVPEDNPLHGLMFFKSRFGSEEVEFIGEHDLVIKPIYYRFLKLAESIFPGRIQG